MSQISTLHEAQVLLDEAFKAGLAEDKIKEIRARLLELRAGAKTQAEYRAIQGTLDSLGSAESYAEFRKQRKGD